MSHGMFPADSSIALTALTALTGVFAVSGLYGLWRVASGRGRGIETVVDVNHVLMSPAMLLMLWLPSAPSVTWVQIAVFSGLALVFFRHLSSSHGVTARTGALLHGGMNLGMVWMLAVGMTGMVGMSDMAGMDHGGGQTWTGLLSWSVVGLLVLSAAWWFGRMVRECGHRMLCCCHGLATGGMAAMLALMTPAL
ncbi:hypothetical protein JOF29_004247 [Kribbella aluminosa]|uniref:DUF5134 domain-containing protein n=1 Tax=Kribbella aluminosa TaxID=416017 RepID=A0ABS4UNG6_9ACTN|nr:DUF5134 domain-containing protein [Kribbella aluminosa]MBP2353164.1 hypothetical protein [Kribbella aluminosa]